MGEQDESVLVESVLYRGYPVLSLFMINAQEDHIRDGWDELSKGLSSMVHNISYGAEITNQHYNTPRSTREEPVRDADRSRIDEAGSLIREGEESSHKVIKHFNYMVSLLS